MLKQKLFFLNSSLFLYFYLFTYISTIDYFELFFDKQFILDSSMYSGITTIISTLISKQVFIFSNKLNFIICFSMIIFLNFIIFLIPNLISNILANKIIFNIHVVLKSFFIVYFLGLNMNLALPLGHQYSNSLNLGISIGSLIGSLISLILLIIFKNTFHFVICFVLIQFIYLIFYIYLIFINFDNIFNNPKLNKPKTSKEKNYLKLFIRHFHLFFGIIFVNIIEASLFPNILMSINYKGIKQKISDQLVTLLFKFGNIFGKGIKRKYSNLKQKTYHIINFTIILFFIFFLLLLSKSIILNGYIIIFFALIVGILYGYLIKVALVLTENSTKTIEEKKDGGFIFSFCIKGGMGLGLIMIIISRFN